MGEEVMKVINLNDIVSVKLTDYGLEILKKAHEDFMKQYSNVRIGEFEKPKTDKDGYTSFQLYELMNIFGPYLSAGTQELPFETDILIPSVILRNKPNKR